jgi:hypothetical protein
MLICATYSLVRYTCTVCVQQKERPKMYQWGLPIREADENYIVFFINEEHCLKESVSSEKE